MGKSTDSGYLVTVDFSLFLPRTCRWNLSAIENYKFDLRPFHWAELRPLTEAIKRPPNCEHLTTYIIYLLHMAVFAILEQGLTWTKALLEVYWGWTDAASAGPLEEVY